MIALTLLGGCLLLQERPIPCDADGPECDGHFACDYDQTCLTACYADLHCVEGYVCTEEGECEPGCAGLDCGAYACQAYADACYESCADDTSCAAGYTCCWDYDLCPDQLGSCIPG